MLMDFSYEIKLILLAAILFLIVAFDTATPVSAQNEGINAKQHEMITSEQALELSSGKVLLHYGEGYSQFDLASLKRRVNKLGLEIAVYSGGVPNHIEFYFYKNKIPKVFSFDESTEILYLAESYAERYKLGRFSDEN